MGKKLNDCTHELNAQKVKASRVLTESNQRWEHERIPMLNEDIRGKWFHRKDSGPAVDVTHLLVPAPLSVSSPDSSAPEISPRVDEGVLDAGFLEVYRKQVKDLETQVKDLETQVEDLRVEKGITERRTEEKVTGLKALLKSVEKERASQVKVKHYTISSDNEEEEPRMTSKSVSSWASASTDQLCC